MRGHILVDPACIAAAVAAWPALGWGAVAAAAGVGLSLHTAGLIHPRFALHGPKHWRLPAGSTCCALTFDDGPDPATTPAVLDLLAAHDQRATFFVIGSHVRAHPHLVRRIHAEGHALGLHSRDHHRRYPLHTPWFLRDDLRACAAVIADVTGAPPPRLFRPPMGLVSPPVAVAAGWLDLLTVTWSGRGRDTGPGADAVAIAARLRPHLQPRAILLLHDGSEPRHPATRAPTVQALDQVLADLAARDLRSRALTVAADGRSLGTAGGATR